MSHPISPIRLFVPVLAAALAVAAPALAAEKHARRADSSGEAPAVVVIPNNDGHHWQEPDARRGTLPTFLGDMIRNDPVELTHNRADNNW